MATKQLDERAAMSPRKWWSKRLLIALALIAPTLGAAAIYAVRQFATSTAANEETNESDLDATNGPPLPKLGVGVPPLLAADASSNSDVEPINLLASYSNAKPKADDLFAIGKFAEAAQMYQEALLNLGTAQNESLSYRLALCYEFSGQANQALAGYRELSTAGSLVVRYAAKLGVARLWLQQGNTDQAAANLSFLISRGRQPEVRLTGIGADAEFLLAHARAADSLFGMPEDPVDSNHIVTGKIEPTAAHLWQIIQGTLPAEAPATDGQSPLKIVGRPKSHPDFVTISATLAPEQIVRILDAITSKLEISLQFTDAAANSLRGRVQELDLQDVSFSAFLDLLTEPQGLSWIYTNNELKIFAENELQLDDRRTVLTQRADRSLRSVLAFYPEHELAIVAYLDLANLAYRSGNDEQAISYYQEINQRYPRHDLTQTAWFNLGKTFYRAHRFDEASAAFYQVIDRRFESGLEATSYLVLGRMSYEQNRLDEAAKAWGLAATHADDLDTEAHAAISLAAARVLSGENAAAIHALMQHRDAIRVDRYRDAAALVASLGRFRASTSVQSRDVAGRQLTEAIIHGKTSDFHGILGAEVMAQALETFGRKADAMRVLQDALPTATATVSLAPVECRLALKVADDYLAVYGSSKECEQLLSQVIDAGDRAWNFQATLRRASLHLNDQEYEKCLASCSNILETAETEDEKKSLLLLMGEAYEALGLHQQAALAYAGMIARPINEWPHGE